MNKFDLERELAEYIHINGAKNLLDFLEKNSPKEYNILLFSVLEKLPK